MRRLLIKLVAIETVLVGWLGYWLFLVYANNPSVNQGLASQLSRFPQLSFTTVDISVLVIIGLLAVILAFKFQRGLKPGIRLERAVQMLENLMKRNLVLEAQVAELKIEKTHVPPPPTTTPSAEPKLGSWERAFRTPIEAGPPIPTITIPSPPPRVATSSRNEPYRESEAPFPRASTMKVEPKPAPPRAVGRPPLVSTEKFFDKLPEKSAVASGESEEKRPASGNREASTWEDSPKRLSETAGILTPSMPPRKPLPVISEENVQKKPYIPVPAPSAPPGVIVGPFALGPGKPLTRVAASPTSRKPPQGTSSPSSISTVKPITAITPLPAPKSMLPEAKSMDPGKPEEEKAASDEPSKPTDKQLSEQTRKKLPSEED